MDTNTLTKETQKPKFKTLELVYMALFVALIAICSWISIPMTIPFTLQTFAVFVTVGLLGMKRGTLSVIAYVILGAIGVPVFAGFSGGFGILLGSTGGYIVGFIFTAFLTGFILDKFGRKLPVMILAMTLGLIVCYAFGTVWFMVVYARTTGSIGVLTTLSWCVIPYIIPDAVKIAIAIVLTKRLSKFVKL